MKIQIGTLLTVVVMSLPWMAGCHSFPRNRYNQAAAQPQEMPKGSVASRTPSPKAMASLQRTKPTATPNAMPNATPNARGPAVAQSRSKTDGQSSSGVVLASAQLAMPTNETHSQGNGAPPHAANCPCCNHNSVYQPMLPALIGGENCGPTACGPTECEPPQVQYMDMQEYLFDGGDRLPRVKIQTDGEAVGLQPEDTVVHYDTECDGTCVEPACRAAVYAPRFAAVRKVATPRHEDLALGPRAALQPTVPSSVKDQLPSPSLNQPQKIAREANVGVIEAFRDRNRGVPVERVVPAMRVSDAFKPYEDLQLIREGMIDETDRFKLQRFVAAANVWGSKEEVEVLIDGKQAVIQNSYLKAQETVIYEIDGKPRIRICKVASQQMAAPGDEIDFTIRVDNVGEREVRNVVVLDSLAPRLEYVEGSQQSSLKAEFKAVENEVGSHKLEWRFSEPMKPTDGGFIRFKCRVR